MLPEEYLLEEDSLNVNSSLALVLGLLFMTHGTGAPAGTASATGIAPGDSDHGEDLASV